MKKSLAFFVLVMPVQVAASPQQDRAAVIAQMSDTYAETATVAAAAPVGGRTIFIDDCAMTIVSTTQYQNSSTIVGFSTHIDLSKITFGSANSPDISYMIQGEGAEFEDTGIIPFYSATPFTVLTHGPLPELLGPKATLAYDVVQTGEMTMGGYNIAQTTPAEIARLAQALVEYQRDYCLPAS